MFITVMDPKGKGIEADNCVDDGATNGVDSQLWQVCAGGLLQMPPVDSQAFYFVQGHLEHASGNVDLRNYPRTPPYILCKVQSIDYLADHDTDEVYAKIRLVSVANNEIDIVDNDVAGILGSEEQDKKPRHFAKTLTQSDANNGGGFSVPRYCAETIFPPLDYSADPPVQNITAKDIHGEPWTFRHIYRGTPRRHLLTTRWSTFVNAKKLVAGDSIVFLRDENEDLCVGIRRTKKVIGGGTELSSGWHPSDAVMQYSGLSGFLRDDENRMARNGNCVSLNSAVITTSGKVMAESVMEAANLAAKGQPFEVVYYPRAGTPEFVVKAARVNTALQIRWCAGMRIRMPFETEDSSRVSWFSGTVSGVQAVDPVRWSDSPWRLLQVTWDEPDLLQNVKRVSPWLVDLIVNMPAIPLSPFTPPRKKLRLLQHPDFALDGQPLMPSGPSDFLGPSNPLGCLPNNFPAGMQGARHAQFGVSLPDIQMNKLQMDLFPAAFPVLDAAAVRPNKGPRNSMIVQTHGSRENVSCLPTVGNSTQAQKKPDDPRVPQFILFGQPILLTEEQMSVSCSGDRVSPKLTEKGVPDGNVDRPANNSNGTGSSLSQHGQQNHTCTERLLLDQENRQEIVFNLDSGLCKVFMVPEDAGRSLDLSLLSSYEELCSKLANMYGIDGSDVLNHLVYQDAAGSSKTAGTEPFSEFARRAKTLKILMDSGSDSVEA